jgi:hypothetical protein
MMTRSLVLCSIGLLSACAAPADDRIVTLTGPAPVGHPTGGDVAVSVVGTPALVALKVPLCAATIAIAAPASAIAGLSPTIDGREEQQYLAWGVDRNCGPPWVVAP